MAFPTGWLSSAKITIDNTKVSGTSNLTNYPLLLTESILLQAVDGMFDADGANPAINGGGDIRFSTDAAGTVQIACEVVTFVTDNTPSNGTAEIWVLVPTVTYSADTDIYIWWEKAAETQPAVGVAFGRNAVWANYDAVYHLEEAVNVTVGGYKDSTGSFDADGISMTLTEVAGAFGGNGQDFDGSADYIDMPDGVWLDRTTYTIQCYAYPDSLATDQRVLSNWHSADSNQQPFLMWIACRSETSMDPDQNRIGSFGGATPEYYNGRVDEVRYCKSVLTDGWITTEYNNMSALSTFATQEAAGGGPVFTATPSAQLIGL